MNTPSFDTRRIPPPGMALGRHHDITLTEEVLALANEHEHHEYSRYHWLSLRFLTFHTGISRLMQALADESQQRIQALIDLAASLPLDKPVLQDPPTLAGQDADPIANAHFFIIDSDVATQALSRAKLEEWWSRRFYERLQAYNSLPQLDPWLNGCISQARAQFQVLQETEGLMPASPCRPQQMPRPVIRHG